MEHFCGQNVEEFGAEKVLAPGAELNRPFWWALKEKTTERIVDREGLGHTVLEGNKDSEELECGPFMHYFQGFQFILLVS